MPFTENMASELVDLLTEDGLRQDLYAGVRVAPGEAIKQWTRPVGQGVYRRIAVDEPSGRVLGGVKISGQLMSWFVAPFCQGRGIGSRIVRDALAAADSDRFNIIDARIARENFASRRIAVKAGFIETGLATRDSGLPPFILYRRTIARG
ncbi:MAG: GNAT family N-acetyltransferase [Pseudomonadota bacterium]